MTTVQKGKLADRIIQYMEYLEAREDSPQVDILLLIVARLMSDNPVEFYEIYG